MINGYVFTGYALIWAALLLYAWRLQRRLRNLGSELAAARGQADPEEATRAGTGDSERTNR